MKTSFLVFFIFSVDVYAFSERGMLPMNHRWHECAMGGAVIECEVEQCESMCADMAKKEKEEKELQRDERIQDIIIDTQQQGDEQNKNPAIFQVQ